MKQLSHFWFTNATDVLKNVASTQPNPAHCCHSALFHLEHGYVCFVVVSPCWVLLLCLFFLFLSLFRYNDVLAPHHSWPVRQIARTALSQCPWRRDMLAKLEMTNEEFNVAARRLLGIMIPQARHK